MSTPFLTPSQSRARREHNERRRRRRRIGGSAAVAVLVAIAAAALVLRGGLSESDHGAAHRARAGASISPAPAAPPAAVSQTGLPLAQPAFALNGLSDPSGDPVTIAFHHPPRAGLLIDLDSGRVLWQRNAERRVRMASLTKMMTALIAVESARARTPILVTRQAIGEGGSKIGVLPLGRRVRLESLLYGLMLPSGNDAAVAIAQHVAGSIQGFVARMNAEAARLGLACTRYSSPSGFYDQGNYTCAADLAMLAHLDLAQKRIARVARTYTAALPFPIKGGKLYLRNNNPLLIYGYPGATGLKTGYTIAAGRCLVATAERHGVRLGVVVMHSIEPGRQAARLLDRGFNDVYHLRRVAEPEMPPGA
jgi:D-alanyl-D-alanine carboxypeptidase